MNKETEYFLKALNIFTGVLLGAACLGLGMALTRCACELLGVACPL